MLYTGIRSIVFFYIVLTNGGGWIVRPAFVLPLQIQQRFLCKRDEVSSQDTSDSESANGTRQDISIIYVILMTPYQQEPRCQIYATVFLALVTCRNNKPAHYPPSARSDSTIFVMESAKGTDRSVACTCERLWDTLWYFVSWHLSCSFHKVVMRPSWQRRQSLS